MTEAGDAQRQLARIALAMVTMRANTPDGQWVEDAFGDAYFKLWDDAREVAGDDANEDMFLSVLNLASAWLRALAEATDRPVSDWLDDERREIDALRFADEEDTDDGEA